MAEQYAALSDAQGMANAFVAHAEARCADAYYAGHTGDLTLPACERARAEYTHAAALFGALLKQPDRYDLPRQKMVHTAMGQLYSRKGLRWAGGRHGPSPL